MLDNNGNSHGSALNPDLASHDREIRLISERVDRLISSLSDSQYHWRPAQSVWSAGDHIDHLIQTAEVVLESINQKIDQAREKGVTKEGPSGYGLVGKFFVDAIEPPAKRKFKSPEVFLPKTRRERSEAASKFAEVQNKILEAISSADGLDLERVKMSSPAAKFIRYNLAAAIAIIPAHERRHLWHIDQLRSHPEFPSEANK